MSFAKRPLSKTALRVLNGPPAGAWMPTVPPGSINMASGYPFPEAVPIGPLSSAWRNLTQREADRPFQYLGSDARNFLWQWVAEAARGLMVTGDAILGTFGALQALDLACRAIVDPDGAVLVQSPTYMEALEIFGNYTDHIVGLPLTDGQFPVADIEPIMQKQLIEGHPVRLIYWGTDFQNPTGHVTPLAERQQLLDVASRFGAWIIEDGAYAELTFEPGLPPLKALDHDGRVIYLGTFSKTLAPGLRVGWAIGPAELLRAMEGLKKDLGNPFIEALVGQYLRDNDYARHVANLRQQYQDRAELMCFELKRRCLPDGVSFRPPTGGYFLWMTLPRSWNSDAVVAALYEEDVIVLSGRHFCLPGSPDPHAIRLSFSYAPKDHLVEGIERLHSVLRSLAFR